MKGFKFSAKQVGKNERELVNGKPHLGVWLGSNVIIYGCLWGHVETRKETEEKLLNSRPSGDFEYRHQQFIYRDPYGWDVLNQSGSIGIKYLLWGRAYKVMRMFKKGSPRYKKAFVNGVMKRRRVDK